MRTRTSTKNILGTQIGCFLITAKNYDKGYLLWECKCLKCGEIFLLPFSKIRKWKDTGCAKCRSVLRYQEKLKTAREKYLNKKFEQLLIKDIYYRQDKEGQNIYANCLCDCGCKKEILLRRILEGGAVTCGHNRDAQLDKGHKISKMAAAGGSSVLAVSDRAINTNNTTGVKGVSYVDKIGKYRAYINYQRKQYHLGCFETLEEAAKARKIAEKNIHGAFVEWYAETYPEKWEELQKHLK